MFANFGTEYGKEVLQSLSCFWVSMSMLEVTGLDKQSGLWLLTWRIGKCLAVCGKRKACETYYSLLLTMGVFICQATGGDDCQVLVFDSTDFSSNGENVGRGLVGPLSSGRVAREGVGVVVTAVAWHPSGLVLAGTSTGKVAAFEVVPGLDGTTSKEEKTSAEVTFLFPSPDGTRGPRVPIPEHAAPMVSDGVACGFYKVSHCFID